MVAGFGFYAYLLTNILWLTYVWRYDVFTAGLALVPGALVAAVVAARLGPLAERHGYRAFVVPGAVVWAGAYVWYHQRVGLEPAFWSQWLPGQVLSGIGVGRDPAPARQRQPGRRAGRPVRHGIRRLLQRPAARRRARHRLARRHPRRAHPGHRGRRLPRRVDALDRRLPRRGRPRHTARPVATHGGGVGRRRGTGIPARPRAAGVVAAAPRCLSSADPTDLSDVPLLTALPDGARHRLERAARRRRAAGRPVLIREGDPPGRRSSCGAGAWRSRSRVGSCARWVRVRSSASSPCSPASPGRRPCGPGATRPWLEVPREALETVLDTDPAAARVVLAQVAERLRTAGGPPGPPPPGARRRRSRWWPCTRARTPRSSRTGCCVACGVHVSTAAPGVVEASGLARAERDHERVLLVFPDRGSGSGDDAAWRDVCLRQADAVVLVARSDAPVPEAPFALAPAHQPELVLVGPPPTQQCRAAWVAATDACQLTIVDGDPAVDLRALGDRLAGRSLGLVLAGGGARAFAHVGVLRELEDAGVHVDRVAGSSIGGVIAAVHATGVDGAALEDRCYLEWVRRQPFGDWRLPTASFAKGNRVRAALVRALGADTVIEGMPRQLQLVSVDLVSRTRQVHRRGSVVDAAHASARLPALFAPIPTDDGRLLVDGGVLDNLPTDLLVRRDEGPVVAVTIGSGGGIQHTGRPRVPALGDTLMRTMMIGSGGAVEAARGRGAWVLNPSTMGVGLLESPPARPHGGVGTAAARLLLERAGSDLAAAAGYLVEDEDDAPAAAARSSSSRLDHPAHRLRGAGLHPQQGRGWPAHAVLQQLPSAVYFRTTDATGVSCPRAPKYGHAGRQHRDVGRAHPADRHGGEWAAVRHPRGWPYRRRRPRHQDHQESSIHPGGCGGFRSRAAYSYPTRRVCSAGGRGPRACGSGPRNSSTHGLPPGGPPHVRPRVRDNRLGPRHTRHRGGRCSERGARVGPSHRAPPAPKARLRPHQQRYDRGKKDRQPTMAGQKIRIRLKAYDHEVIDSSARKIVDNGHPYRRERNRGPGAAADREERRPRHPLAAEYKDSREHFEMRTHKRLIDILDPTPKTVDSLMRLDLPAGVDIEIKL